jgi:prepilin-type N-terminal cleavage/methylation domain-containing protein
MPKMTVSSMVSRKSRLASFTLVELLVVMAIIAILCALVLMAASGVWTKAARNRAASEIQAMSTALESYKTDNGIYPPSDGVLLTNSPYSAYDGSQINYQTNSQILYLALSGQTNFTDTPAAGTKAYMSFKANQVGNPTGASGGGSYVKDPWNYSYGYSTGSAPSAATTNYPYNGGGFFDLWSTGGLLAAKVAATPSLTNAWISNWQ